MIHNVEITESLWRNDLGRDGKGLGLIISTRFPDSLWSSCAQFDQETAQRVLSGFGVSGPQELVGKWCVVETDTEIGTSNVSYLGPFSDK